MYAHSTTLSTDPCRVDDAVHFVEDDVLPAVTGLDGCLGLSLLIHRGSGLLVATTAWEDVGCMRASGERRRFAERDDLFLARPEQQEWEIAVVHRVRPVRAGAWARVAWMIGDANDVDLQVDVYRMLAVPVLHEIEGFCSASLLIDRRAGRGVSSVTYESRAALDAGREQAIRMRKDAVALTGVEVERSLEMQLALAHLRVPETV
jgi:hypothetical protein